MVYTFGPFSIDSDTRLLFRDTERIPLPPKAADVLLALVEREGQLVTKDELLNEVWRDTFVEEGNLARQIFLLRKTLGETADNVSYVETVPKRGYRFIGPVQRQDLNAVTLTAEQRTSEHIIIEETETPDPPRRRDEKRRVAIGIGLVIIVGVVASLVWARARTTLPVRSLLVLPFANLSIAGDTEYYSDGLTEELISAFSSVEGLRVVPRTTAFQFKGKSGDVRTIGRQLEADAVLDGRVQRDGNRLRIYLSLTHTSDGHTIWSRTYDGKPQDVFDTQQEIATSVLRAIFPGQKHAVDVLSPSGTRNPQAQTLFLKASFISQKFFNSSLTNALALFEQAAALDPSYAQAWAGQAFCYASLADTFERYPKDVLPLAVQAADRALALNPRLALAHAIRGHINLSLLRDWDAARRELETAIELNPHDGESHHWMSHLWVALGRFKEADQEAHSAVESDPLNISLSAHMAWVAIMNHRYDDAVRAAHNALQLDSRHVLAHVFLMLSYEYSGQLTEAIRIRRLMQWQDAPVDDLEAALRTRGPGGYWQVILQALEAKRKHRPTGLTDLARVYTRLGDRDRAVEWLQRAVEERDPWAVYVKVDPAFDVLRSYPAFQQIVRAAGLP